MVESKCGYEWCVNWCWLKLNSTVIRMPRELSPGAWPRYGSQVNTPSLPPPFSSPYTLHPFNSSSSLSSLFSPHTTHPPSSNPCVSVMWSSRLFFTSRFYSPILCIYQLPSLLSQQRCSMSLHGVNILFHSCSPNRPHWEYIMYRPAAGVYLISAQFIHWLFYRKTREHQ